jgi:ABC-type nickel/cobalt efflux system permease component RcnA
MQRIKEEVKKGYVSAVKIVHGAEHLVLSLSIIIVSYYNIYDLQTRQVDNFELYVRSLASVVVALVGAWNIAKVLKAIGEKDG